MTAYRKKPVVIDATQWLKHGDHPAVIKIPADHPIDKHSLAPNAFGWVPTLEGGHVVTRGDWIITGVQGEKYACKPEIFAATYELAALPTDPEAIEADRATHVVNQVPAGWQPIETAPKYKEVLLYRDDAGAFTGIFTSAEQFLSDGEQEQLNLEELEAEDWFGGDYRGSWRLDGDEKPTHWMPLPAAPSATDQVAPEAEEVGRVEAEPAGWTPAPSWGRAFAQLQFAAKLVDACQPANALTALGDLKGELTRLAATPASPQAPAPQAVVRPPMCRISGVSAGVLHRAAIANGNGVEPAQAVVVEESERTPTDFALEHAEYMATTAEDLMEAIGKLAYAELRRDEATDESSIDYDAMVDQAREDVGESMDTICRRIYEFRKRRDRAALIPSPAPSAAPHQGDDALRLDWLLRHISVSFGMKWNRGAIDAALELKHQAPQQGKQQ